MQDSTVSRPHIAAVIPLVTALVVEVSAMVTAVPVEVGAEAEVEAEEGAEAEVSAMALVLDRSLLVMLTDQSHATVALPQGLVTLPVTSRWLRQRAQRIARPPSRRARQ